MVRIKGADEPGPTVRRLLERGRTAPAEAGVPRSRRMVGRELGVSRSWRRCWIARSVDAGRWWVWSALPGIGKTRLIREVAAMAATRGVDVFTAFCESHTSDVPFQVVARLLRGGQRRG